MLRRSDNAGVNGENHPRRREWARKCIVRIDRTKQEGMKLDWMKRTEHDSNQSGFIRETRGEVSSTCADDEIS